MQLKLTEPRGHTALRQHLGHPNDPQEPPALPRQVTASVAAGGAVLTGYLGHRSACEADAAYLWCKALSRAMTLKSNFVDRYLLGLRLSQSMRWWGGCTKAIRLVKTMVLSFLLSFTLSYRLLQLCNQFHLFTSSFQPLLGMTAATHSDGPHKNRLTWPKR